jgi:uncharacterized membrane protein YgdD (TMEM256/DUF423 family)
MNKNIVLTASVFGVMAVILGAFGAHSLKESIGETALATWTKGVEYQFYHVFALLFLANIKEQTKLTRLAHIFFSIGIIFFSGSLYILSTKAIHQLEIASYIGPITPVGGLFFILGWMMLFFTAAKKN